MEQTCLRCSRLAFRPVRGAAHRTFVTSRTQFDESSDGGVSKAGSSITDALTKKSLIRKVDLGPSRQDANANVDTANPVRRPRPLIRRTSDTGNTASSPAGGSGLVIRRTSAPGQVLTRSRPAGPSAGNRPGGSLLRRTSKPQQGPRSATKTDKRRRRAPREQEEDDTNPATLNKAMDDYIAKYVDRPDNPTEPVPYQLKETKVEDLRSDWPNTPLSTVGMTESVIQKIEWLARRLPHGFQSPEQIAERYLHGDLTRFESEEEKQLVLKIASEMSAKTKQLVDEGSMNKYTAFRVARFIPVDDPKFTSIYDKENDKNFLMNSSVKGDYEATTQQKYPFMQNVARVLGNNGTYGPAQAQKLLDRVQALIPQGRVAAEVKKA